jgi:molybdopterin adenylyltransferase
MGKIKAISISNRKGVRKNNIDSAQLLIDYGLENDAHGGTWHRQVSLLAQESIDFMRAKGLDVVAGNFAENITTEGIDLTTLPVGSRLTVGEAELVISQLGKICHTRCAIYHQAGDCVMPREGIFAVVRIPGRIKVGDSITVQNGTSAGLAIIATQETLNMEEDQLRMQAETEFAPAFLRLDTISSKQGGDIDAILKDLTETQRIPTIVVYDPPGKLALAMVGIDRDEQRPNWYRCHDSSILYCRDRGNLHP